MAEYTIDQVARAAGITRRCVRVYVEKGLLPAPVFRGKATTYSEAWLTRLKAIRRLIQVDRLALEDIRRRLAKLSPSEIAALAGVPCPAPGPEDAHTAAAPAAVPPAGQPAPAEARVAPTAAPSSPAGEPPAVEAGGPPLGGERWDHVPLLPGLELHLRSDATALVRRIAAEIVAQYAGFPGDSPPTAAG
jgi:DNA-binding transcriptional MerR regulator